MKRMLRRYVSALQPIKWSRLARCRGAELHAQAGDGAALLPHLVTSWTMNRKDSEVKQRL
jgi:hypothetical protein